MSIRFYGTLDDRPVVAEYRDCGLRRYRGYLHYAAEVLIEGRRYRLWTDIDTGGAQARHRSEMDQMWSKGIALGRQVDL